MEIRRPSRLPPSLKAPDSDTTVVTAFYSLRKSKHSLEKYTRWIANFFEACTSPVLCFTSGGELHDRIRASITRPETVILNSTALTDWRVVSEIRWQDQVALDPERAIHGPELYGVWALKQEAVMEAIAQNPFRTQNFVWCDIGCFRDMSAFPSPPRFATIPRVLQGPAGWFAALSVNDVHRTELYEQRSRKMIQRSHAIKTIGGGVLAGDIRGWSAFSHAYRAELLGMLRRGEFCGKDQLVYRRVLFGGANAMPGIKVSVIPARREWFGKTADEWFTLTYLFSGL